MQDELDLEPNGVVMQDESDPEPPGPTPSPSVRVSTETVYLEVFSPFDQRSTQIGVLFDASMSSGKSSCKTRALLRFDVFVFNVLYFSIYHLGSTFMYLYIELSSVIYIQKQMV